MTHPEHSLIWALYLEGAAEDMIMSSLRKLQASPEEIGLFSRKENGKMLFKPEHVATLFKWIKMEHGNARELADDYKNYLKYFPNKKLDQFKSYIDWTQQVHDKRDEDSYESRYKDIGDIEIEGQDRESVLADDEDVLILRGDDEHKCVRYGKGYSFCISRTGGGNMYGTYRLSKSSTFYFVFFKKIPRENERHIMVLDRTSEGWEWTFGKNQTKVIEGGWNKITKTFPVLAKYKNLFINKPLTDEEKDYQEKLGRFVDAPSMDKFNEFTYKQRADVLKFGMLIPLDVFNSLNKFLRNEWVGVGPKMSDDIYEKLSSSERSRFTKVREQQLYQREFEDKYDIEICNNNPELYDKHIKSDEELSKKEEKEINAKIKDGTLNENLIIASKLFFPNLDNLLVVKGDIFAHKAQNLSLPRLQQCKNFIANSLASLSLPRLQQSGDIYVAKATDLNLPHLQKSGYIFTYVATDLNLPRLQKTKNIYAKAAKRIVVPSNLKSNIFNISKDCEVVEPDAQQLNDSVLQDLMKKYLLAK
jgi:hypothetical protein